MSTLQVANVHFESTGNNRVQYNGTNNYTLYAAGSPILIINSTAINAVSNTFNLGSALFQANNGYTRLPNGLLLQWGLVVANSTSTNVTFSVPHTTAVYSATITGANSTAAANASIPYVNSVNTTVISIRSANVTTGAQVYWNTIGI